MSPDQIQQALSAFATGKCVGMPTETVYGLAAPINDQNLIKKIFSIKSRPSFDPLIVHVSDIAMAQKLVVNWSSVCDALAEKFWPGPLTLVLKKRPEVSDLITSGLDTVGIRMPNHSVAIELIEKAGIPLAAPSANKFGKTSPTSAAHVRSEFSEQEVFVLEGGESQVGIESTILEIVDTEAEPLLRILRPGMVLKSEIEKALQERGLDFSWLHRENSSMISSAGQLKHHYMPRVPLILLNETDELATAISQFQNAMKNLPSQVEGVEIRKPTKFASVKELELSASSSLAARELYGKLRSVDGLSTDLIYFRVKSVHQKEEWRPIMDRLWRASLWKSTPEPF